MTAPPVLRARLLGRFEILRDGAARPVRLSTKKARALVAYLAMSRHQTASREHLATLLWGSCPEQQAKQSLRQALASIRKDLGSPDALFTDHEIARLQAGTWSVDACDLETLAASSRIEDLQRAIDLFDGEFLAGLTIEEEGFAEWLRSQRDRTQQIAIQAHLAYARATAAAGRGDQAIAAIERILALDPFREDWHRFSLELYARYRGRSEALARAKRFDALLQRELGVAAEPETKAIVELIERGDIALVAAVGDAEERHAGESGSARVRSTLPSERLVLPDVTTTAAAPARRRHVSPVLAAALAAVLLAGAVGLVTLRPDPVATDTSANKPAASIARTSDPWQSPRLPSQAGVDLQGTPEKVIASVAVLPFTTYGDNAGSLQLFSDMLTDDLINTLSRVPPLRVISRQTMRSYLGRPIDVAVVGAELGVRYVLEGKVRTVGDKLRVSTELIDPPTRAVIWSARIDRDVTERDAIPDEIVGRLARQLQFEVYRAESARAPQDPSVQELSYKGWAAMFTSATTGVEALRQAQHYFTEALARDPQNASARVGIGAYHAVIGSTLADGESLKHMEKGEALLRDAARANPDRGSIYFYLGIIYRSRGRLEEGYDALEHALSINPSDASSYAHLGHTLLWMGRAREGLEHIRYALRLSPLDATRSHWLRFAGEALLELGEYDQAVAEIRQSLELNPNSPLTLRSLAAAYALSGRMVEAQQSMNELKKTAPHLSFEQMTKIAARRKTVQMQRGLRLAGAAPAETH